jgi:hypothetical protein
MKGWTADPHEVTTVLIDATHKRWFYWTAGLAVASVGLYVALGGWTTAGGLPGGSTVGLWYGIAGSALMVYAGLLAAHRKVPGWSWIGARQTWLRGHIWLGLLSVVLIVCHSGGRLGGLVEQILWAILGLTILSGVFGLMLQQFIPRILTLRVPSEAPYEQLPHICAVMRHKGDAIVTAVLAADVEVSQATMRGSHVGFQARNQFKDFYLKEVRPFLGEPGQRGGVLANPLKVQATLARLRSLPGLASVKDKVTELETLCEEYRQLAVQQRLHHWLHVWLLVHIPLSILLLVFGVVHIVTSLYY